MQVGEFVAILRMRQVDVGWALDRAEALARRMWHSKVLQFNWSLMGLRKIGVIMGLAKWYFESLAHTLVPEPKVSSHTESPAPSRRQKT